jgi:hypothetical protein
VTVIGPRLGRFEMGGAERAGDSPRIDAGTGFLTS